MTTWRIERASSTDRAFLAMDTGAVPEQFGVLLRLDGDLDLPEVRRLLADRVMGLPRLRQVLEETPLGCGGPVWTDDPGFDIARHVEELPRPGDEAALLDAALACVLRPLRRDRPLWRVALVPTPDGPSGHSTVEGGAGAGLVMVLHHALADGLAGLAVLAALVDPETGTADGASASRSTGSPSTSPMPRPPRSALARDAWQRRVRAVRDLPDSARLLRRSFAGAGGLLPPRAADCSLRRPTGPRRAVAVVRTELDPVRAAAHSVGASTNDAVLVAVARALGAVLRTRGESVPELVVTVPVAGRSVAEQDELGNLVSPIIVPVPTTGSATLALVRVADAVRAQKSSATGQPPIALLGWVFRPLARLGGYRWYMYHQHRLHTLVSHLRGPGEPLTFAGRKVASAVPLAVGDGGNIPVFFEVLSYAGTLTVSVIVDPEQFPELDRLALLLEGELLTITALGGPS